MYILDAFLECLEMGVYLDAFLECLAISVYLYGDTCQTNCVDRIHPTCTMNYIACHFDMCSPHRTTSLSSQRFTGFPG